MRPLPAACACRSVYRIYATLKSQGWQAVHLHSHRGHSLSAEFRDTVFDMAAIMARDVVQEGGGTQGLDGSTQGISAQGYDSILAHIDRTVAGGEILLCVGHGKCEQCADHCRLLKHPFPRAPACCT